MSVNWSYFDKFDEFEDMYLPRNGEGETEATQAVTAVCKIIYKWYNDGDVYDNTYHLEGWWNDISSYANWLYRYIPATTGIKEILERIYDVTNSSEYESEILKPLADTIFDYELLNNLNQHLKEGSIYTCHGPFKYVEEEEEKYEEEYDDEEYDEDDYDDIY